MRQRRWVIGLVVAVVVALPAAQVRVPAGVSEHVVRVDGLERRYLLHIPPGPPAGPRPLVLAFHGGAGNPGGMVRLTGLDDLADREGFVVAYPAGTGRLRAILTWNAGACCGYAARHDVDDVAFVEAVIADIADRTPVDRARLYATGMSNGAQMVYRLAAERPGLLAAIAPVAGSLEVPVGAEIQPVPVMHFHGTADDHLPFDGGRGPASIAGVAFASVEHSVGTWVRINGCRPEPVVTPLPDQADDGTRVERRDYRGCRADVVLVVIEGGGHTWPGTARLERLLGVATRDIDASAMMWTFFARHTR